MKCYAFVPKTEIYSRMQTRLSRQWLKRGYFLLYILYTLQKNDLFKFFLDKQKDLKNYVLF